MSPIEDRMRQKAVLEQTRPGAHAGNSQREPSVPPATNLDAHLEVGAKRATHGKAILGFSVALLAAVAGGVAYLQTRPSKADVDAAEARASAIATAKNEQVAGVSERVAKVETKIDDMRAEESRRWDALDKILERNFGASTSATPPPTFGPAARRQGRQ